MAPAALSLILVLAGAASAGPDTLVIADVSVLPMDRPGVLMHRTVIMAEGRIVRIEAAGTAPPPRGAMIVDGRGKFLLPGLADMHVHLSTAEELPMYLANGVLTVRDLNGSLETLAWREAIAAGTLAGPRLLVSGPMLSGPDIPWRNKVTPATAAEAEAAVLAQKAEGYDQIKIYDGLSREVFEAAVATARRVGLLVTGHIPAAVGFSGVLGSGMRGLEHLDKTVFAVVRHDLDTLRIPMIVDSIRKSGMWVTPTLGSMIQLAKVGGGRYDSLMARPEARSAPGPLRDFWTSVTGRLRGDRLMTPGARYNPWTDYQMKLAAALARAGVPLLAGSDLPNAVQVPGYALHGELDALVEAGLSREQALVAATSAPARFMGQDGDWGAVAPGHRANLLLADANPLEGLATLRSPAGVVVAGRWLDRARLAALLPRR